MISQKTATDVQHHTICKIRATTRCATAAAAARASSTNADDDDRIHPWIWAASLVEHLVDDRLSISIAVGSTAIEMESRSRGCGIMIRIKHRSVSSGILLAETSYVRQSFHKEAEHEVRSPALSSVLLSQWVARRFQRIYPDISGYIPDSAEEPGFWKALQLTLNATAEHREQLEANHPAVFDCQDLRLTGTAGFFTWTERRCIAGSSWRRGCRSLANGASWGSQTGSAPASPVLYDQVAFRVAHWQFAGRFRTTIWAISFATLSIKHNLSLK